MRAHAVTQRQSPFWTVRSGSPSRLQNTFAHECMMDELAARRKPILSQYRLRHLRDPRLRAVVQAAAKAANWEARPVTEAGARTNRNADPVQAEEACLRAL